MNFDRSDRFGRLFTFWFSSIVLAVYLVFLIFDIIQHNYGWIVADILISCLMLSNIRSSFRSV